MLLSCLWQPYTIECNISGSVGALLWVLGLNDAAIDYSWVWADNCLEWWNFAVSVEVIYYSNRHAMDFFKEGDDKFGWWTCFVLRVICCPKVSDACPKRGRKNCLWEASYGCNWFRSKKEWWKWYFFVDYYYLSHPRVKFTFVMLDSNLNSAVVAYSWLFILLGWGGVCWGENHVNSCFSFFSSRFGSLVPCSCMCLDKIWCNRKICMQFCVHNFALNFVVEHSFQWRYNRLPLLIAVLITSLPKLSSGNGQPIRACIER